VRVRVSIRRDLLSCSVFMNVYVSLQACNVTQGHCQNGTTEQINVGGRVEKYWYSAIPRMGTLHETRSRYLFDFRRIYHFISLRTSYHSVQKTVHKALVITQFEQFQPGSFFNVSLNL